MARADTVPPRSLSEEEPGERIELREGCGAPCGVFDGYLCESCEGQGRLVALIDLPARFGRPRRD